MHLPIHYYVSCAIAGVQDVFEVCVVNGVGIVPLDECPLNLTLSQACNLQPCSYNFHVQPFTKCNDNCGPGHQFQSVACTDPYGFSLPLAHCVQSASLSSDASAVLSDVGGDAVLNWPAPISNHSTLARTCATSPCAVVRCVFHAMCCPLLVVNVRKCMTLALCRYGWRPWGQCDNPCTPAGVNSTAVRSRQIVCLYQNSKVVLDSYCDDLLLPRPVDWEVCNTYTCDQYVFRVGNWSACSTSCGFGTKTRTVECLDPAGA